MRKIGLFCITFLLTVAFLSNSLAQEYTRWHLPEGAIARLGKGSIRDVEFSLDGKRLAVATDIGIWIYNTHTGAEIALVKRQPRGISAVNTIAFAPDGTTLAVGSGRLGGAIGAVELWDTMTGKRLTVLGEDIGSVQALEFSADGTTLASVSWSGTMKYYLWEVATGREVLSFTKAHGRIPHSKSALVLSHAPYSVASTDVDTVKIWDVATEELRHTLAENGNPILALAFSPDGKTLAGSYHTIRLWDTETGNEFSKLGRHRHGVYIMAFSPDGRILASGDTGGKVILWDLDSPNPKPFKQKSTLPNLLRSITGDKSSETNNTLENPLIEHTLPIEALDFTTDSQRLVTGSQDGAAIMWDVETGNRLFTVTGHTGSVKALEFLEDDKTLISASSDGTLRIWETGTGNQQLIPVKHKRSIFCMAFSADHKTVAIGGVGNDVHLWDADTKNFVATFKTEHKDVVDTLAFSPDDKILASGSRDRKVELWDVPNHQRLSILDGYTDGIIEMTFSADGKKFASRSRDGTAHLWDLDTEKKTVLVTPPNSGVNALAFSPDSSTLVSACWDEIIQLWDANTHQHIADLIVSPTVRHLEFSPDGKTVVMGSESGLILLWDVDTRTVSHEIRTGDAARPTAFAFTQDGKTLVSGNSDGTIFIWDLENITQR